MLFAAIDHALLDEVFAEQLPGQVARHERWHAVLHIDFLSDATLLAEPEPRPSRD